MTTLIEKTLIAARKVQPELWKRTEQVARIIDPAAFVDGWVVRPEDSRKAHEARIGYMRAVAMHKAQEILKVLGVNTDADWYAILTELRAIERTTP